VITNVDNADVLYTKVSRDLHLHSFKGAPAFP